MFKVSFSFKGPANISQDLIQAVVVILLERQPQTSEISIVL